MPARRTTLSGPHSSDYQIAPNNAAQYIGTHVQIAPVNLSTQRCPITVCIIHSPDGAATVTASDQRDWTSPAATRSCIMLNTEAQGVRSLCVHRSCIAKILVVVKYSCICMAGTRARLHVGATDDEASDKRELEIFRKTTAILEGLKVQLGLQKPRRISSTGTCLVSDALAKHICRNIPVDLRISTACHAQRRRGQPVRYVGNHAAHSSCPAHRAGRGRCDRGQVHHPRGDGTRQQRHDLQGQPAPTCPAPPLHHH
jgi:hypothetical protein